MFSFTWCLLLLWLQVCLQSGCGILVLSGGDWRWKIYARKVLVTLIRPNAVPIWCHMELEVSYFNNCLNMLIMFASSNVLSFPGHLILFLFQLCSMSVWELREHVRVPQAPDRGKNEMLMSELWYRQARDPQCHGMSEGRACPAVAILTFQGASHLLRMCYPAAVPPVRQGWCLPSWQQSTVAACLLEPSIGNLPLCLGVFSIPGCAR